MVVGQKSLTSTPENSAVHHLAFGGGAEIQTPLFPDAIRAWTTGLAPQDRGHRWLGLLRGLVNGAHNGPHVRRS